MRITEVRVGAAKTIGLPNYSSFRIEASLTAEIGEGEELATVKAKLQLELKELMEQTYRAQQKAKTEVHDNADGAKFFPAQPPPVGYGDQRW